MWTFNSEQDGCLLRLQVPRCLETQIFAFFFKVDEHFFFCFVFDSLQFTAVNLQLKDQTALCQCDTAQPSDTPSVPPEIPPLKFGTT